MNECTLQDPRIIHRYYDGELDGDAATKVEEHLASCPTCRALVASLADMGASIRQCYGQEIVPDLTANLVRRLQDSRLRSSRRIAWNLVAAASILFVSSLFLVGYSKIDQDQGSAAMAPWEENLISSLLVEEEYADVDSSALIAIHIQKNPTSENENE